MHTHSNGSAVPSFDSYDSILEFVRSLEQAGITPDSIIILTPPPPPPSH